MVGECNEIVREQTATNIPKHFRIKFEDSPQTRGRYTGAPLTVEAQQLTKMNGTKVERCHARGQWAVWVWPYAACYDA